METYDFNSEKLVRRRFPDNKSFHLDIFNRATIVRASLLDLLPSNYPQDENTNLAALFNVFAREFSRIRWDIDAVNSDKEYSHTRIEYLQQILGERLFLSKRIAPANYNDESFREYLISIKNAYLAGSTKVNIEKFVSEWTHLPVRLKELYLDARKPGSSYGVQHTHKMVLEVFIEDLLQTGRNLSQLSQDLDFFVGLVRPAHVLYDTRFIWTECIETNKVHDHIFGDTGGGCIPVYDYNPLLESLILARQVVVTDNRSEATGRIDSIQHDFLAFFLEDGTGVIIEPGINGTSIFDRSGRHISFEELKIGDYVKVISLPIPGSFKFWWFPAGLFTTPYSQYWPSVYRRPIFQEYVKKKMDSKGRFPEQIATTPTTICDRWVQDLLWPEYEDLCRSCRSSVGFDSTYTTILSDRLEWPQLSLPYLHSEVYNKNLYGNLYGFVMPHTPLTDGSGGPATPSNIVVSIDGTRLTEAVVAVDASSGFIELSDSTSYWKSAFGRNPVICDQIGFGYTYWRDGTDTSADSTFIYGMSPWRMPHWSLLSTDGSNSLAQPEDVRVSVDGTFISDAVMDLNPLFGHVYLNTLKDFWLSSELGRLPRVGDVLRFYYRYGFNSYSVIFDDPSRVFDSFGGVSWPFSFVFDAPFNDVSGIHPIPVPDLVKIGYRYRAYHLHHSSVLNSPDTLLLNNFQRPVTTASLVNQQHSLTHYNIIFSPEFLNDTSTDSVLDDGYLENGLDPVLKLNPGIPPFQKTFSYQPTLIYERKLQDIRVHRHPLIYSDLILKEIKEGERVESLNPICDSNSVAIKTRVRDELPAITECDSWIYMDTATRKSITVHIPSEKTGVPNLRIVDKKLRYNFILRETEETGVISALYLTKTSGESAQTVFYLPKMIKMDIPEIGIADFPALPIVKSKTELAEPTDINVTLRGSGVLVLSLDPIIGRIEIERVVPFPIVDNNVLTAFDIIVGWTTLSGYPVDPSSVLLTVHKPSGSFTTTDFYVQNQRLIWKGGPLEKPGPYKLEAGDRLEISYEIDPLINSSVAISYKILGTQQVEFFDEKLSRITDNGYVYASRCPDPIRSSLCARFDEYVNFLDDYGDGIKIVYLNKLNYQLEEHVFTGPVFEIYDPSQDEFGSPDAFPNALVRLKTARNYNPLTAYQDYAFLRDPIVRFRKKVFKELLPDKTFRTIKITEVATL